VGCNGSKRRRRKYEDLDTEADVKKKRLELIGTVVRMDQGRTVKEILESEQ